MGAVGGALVLRGTLVLRGALVLRGGAGRHRLGQASITENGSSGFHGLGVIRKMLAEGATDSGQASITDKL